MNMFSPAIRTFNKAKLVLRSSHISELMAYKNTFNFVRSTNFNVMKKAGMRPLLQIYTQIPSQFYIMTKVAISSEFCLMFDFAHVKNSHIND